MKSLKDLIEEIRREASGETTGARGERRATTPPPAGAGRRAPVSRAPTGTEVDESDFDLVFDLGIDEEERAAAPVEAPRPRPAPVRMPVEAEPVPPERMRKVRRRRWARGFRRLLLVTLAAALGTGGALWLETIREGRGIRVGPGEAIPGLVLDQRVVVWTLAREDPAPIALISVVAAGGGLDPVVVGVPSYTIANIPGYGLATLGDAAGVEGSDLVSAAVENLLGVRVDGSAAIPLEGLAPIVDAVGGVDVGGRRLDGQAAIEYLERGSEAVVSAEFQFLRWQEVSAGVLAALDRRPEALVGLPADVAQVIARAGASGADLLELPVEDIGAGLARPDADAVSTLVAERFQPTAQVQGDVRLVVLNGEGTPGIGERVARVLVPAGFRLVSSLNAPTFDVEETQIVAADREFLDEAEVARELLGVGEVFLGDQATRVADVTVLIGADFGGP